MCGKGSTGELSIQSCILAVYWFGVEAGSNKSFTWPLSSPGQTLRHFVWLHILKLQNLISMSQHQLELLKQSSISNFAVFQKYTVYKNLLPSSAQAPNLAKLFSFSPNSN